MPWETDPMEAVLLLQRAAIVLLGGYNAAHFGAMWQRMGRQGAVAAGEGRPGEAAAAGERRRGRRIGAFDSWQYSAAQVAGSCSIIGDVSLQARVPSQGRGPRFAARCSGVSSFGRLCSRTRLCVLPLTTLDPHATRRRAISTASAATQTGGDARA